MFSKLGKKIYILFLSLSFLSITLYFSVSSQTVFRQVTRLHEEQFLLATENIQSKLARFKQQMLQNLTDLAQDSDLIFAVETKNDESIQRWLNLRRISMGAISINLLSNSSGRIYNSQEKDREATQTKPTIRAIGNGPREIIETMEINKETYLLGTVSVKKGGQVLADLSVIYSYKKEIFDYLRTITSEPFIVARFSNDKFNSVVFHTADPETVAELTTAFAKRKKKSTMNEGVVFEIQSPNEIYSGFLKKIDQTAVYDYYLLFVKSSAEEIQSLKTFFLGFAFLSLVLFALGLIFAQIGIFKVADPFLELTEAIREVTSGENPSLHKISSRDEVGQLFSIITKIHTFLRSQTENLNTEKQRESDQEQRLMEANQRAAKNLQRIKLLLDIAESTNFLSDTQQVLNLILEKLALGFEFHRTSIMLIDTKTATFELKIIKGFNKESDTIEDILMRTQIRLGIGEGIAGLALERGEILVADEGSQHSDFKKYGSLIDSTVRYLVCVPLVLNERRIGVINLSHGEQVEPLDTEDLHFLNICARQIAITLENSRIFESSISDSMTDLFNFRYFQDRLINEMRRVDRRKTSLALVSIAIDKFSSLVELQGAKKAEALIGEVASHIQSILRGTDLGARVKGDEFAMLLCETNTEGARIVAQKIIDNVAETRFGGEAKNVALTVSAGIAIYPADSKGVSDLIRLAEYALNKAQERGPGSIMGFNKSPARK